MPRWRCDLDLRHVGADVFGSVAPHAVARQVLSRRTGWRDKANIMGPRQPLLPHPLSSLSSFRQLRLQRGRRRRRPPDPLQIRRFGGGKVGGIVPLPPLKVFP